jgi:carboxylesterase type B
MPPKSHNSTERTEATAFSPACLQTVPGGGLLGFLGSFAMPRKMSEDCLYLNVWTKPQMGEKKKGEFNVRVLG